MDINRYAYAGNDPINQSDANGHSYGPTQSQMDNWYGGSRSGTGNSGRNSSVNAHNASGGVRVAQNRSSTGRPTQLEPNIYDGLIRNEMNLQRDLLNQIRNFEPSYRGPEYFSSGQSGMATSQSLSGVQRQTEQLRSVLDSLRSSRVCEPTGFRGSLGFELRNPPYQRNRNFDAIINGRLYKGHALDQMQNRGVIPSAVESAISNGAKFPTRGRTLGYFDKENNIRVITDFTSGRVITVIRGAP